MEYYSTIKKNEIMSFAGKQMKPEIIITRKISQIQDEKYYMLSLICGI
jgi:hypothetical protein